MAWERFIDEKKKDECSDWEENAKKEADCRIEEMKTHADPENKSVYGCVFLKVQENIVAYMRYKKTEFEPPAVLTRKRRQEEDTAPLVFTKFEIDTLFSLAKELFAPERIPAGPLLVAAVKDKFLKTKPAVVLVLVCENKLIPYYKQMGFVKIPPYNPWAGTLDHYPRFRNKMIMDAECVQKTSHITIHPPEKKIKKS